MKKRVVITGIGAITPVGNTVDEYWDSLKEGKHGFGPITQFDASAYKCKLVGEVKNFVAKDYIDAGIISSDWTVDKVVETAWQPLAEKVSTK